ncbi:hypothetical protein T492DRAFT_1095990 [Pavlovales sp. CCMP2436]|nr:hypothetical protein T492DRAFT_1095990 [Pavlovales sp. CCMP2436]|mmetsp:Transcript_45115/g.111878  ORF Transcript_45115/g.111878 Transcript_45115/m.111878 type:complete len:156 (+) Transcript_45115:120-587(+)
MAPSCPICLAEALVDASALLCGHAFCTECIDKWYTHSPLQTCPVCRSSPLSRPDSAPRIAVPASQNPVSYPRASIRAQIEREEDARTAAYARRRAFENRLASYQANLASPISGRPISELERINVEDFEKHFGRGRAGRSAALSSLITTSPFLTPM